MCSRWNVNRKEKPLSCSTQRFDSSELERQPEQVLLTFYCISQENGLRKCFDALVELFDHRVDISIIKIFYFATKKALFFVKSSKSQFVFIKTKWKKVEKMSIFYQICIFFEIIRHSFFFLFLFSFFFLLLFNNSILLFIYNIFIYYIYNIMCRFFQNFVRFVSFMN